MFEGLDDGSFAGIAQIDDPDFSVPCATTVYAWTWTDGDLNVVPQSRGETDQSLDREDRDATVPERGDLRRIEMQPYREEAGSHWCRNVQDRVRQRATNCLFVLHIAVCPPSTRGSSS